MTTQTPGTGTASSGEDAVSDPETLAGTWSVQAVIGGNPVPHSTTVVFAADHTLTMLGPEGPDGKPSFTGSGHWLPRPDGTFVCYLTHPIPDGNGGVAGVTHGIQQGTVSGDTHTSSGSVVFHHSDGTVDKPVTMELTATR